MNTTKAGFWTSPISATMLASKSTRLGQMRVIGDQLYWLESRPEEQGRGVIVRHDPRNQDFDTEHQQGATSVPQELVTQDITPPTHSVRSRAHEMGGGCFWGREHQLIFVSARSQSLYLQDLHTLSIRKLYDSQHDESITERFTDGDISPCGQWSLCVRERHTKAGVFNEVVAISIATGALNIIAQGKDFYSNPRFSPVGSKVSWVSWSHPNMPWDATELWCADYSVDEHNSILLNTPACVAGNDSQEDVSIYCPQWSPRGELFYISDASEKNSEDEQQRYWQIWAMDSQGQHRLVQKPSAIEFGIPQWIFGTKTYEWISDTELMATGIDKGAQALYRVNISTGQLTRLDTALNAFSGQIECLNGHIYTQAASSEQSSQVVRLSLLDYSLFPKPTEASMTISHAQPLSFPTANEREQQVSHAFYYPPVHADSEAHFDQEELPPLIVISHGGPTGMTDAGLDLNIQYWTSRGFAVVDVNYRGSTGFGRVYREQLKGQWGIADVEDCIAAVDYLAAKGLADPNRVAIRGGSAGGFTTLCALTFHDRFKVGMSRYGVADLIALAEDTHKFEERYLDSMVGEYPAEKALYIERSPINHVDKLSCPLLILQGLDDKIVPPNQSESMAQALERKGIPYRYMTFEGEGHGFRKPQTIVDAFTAELEFYQEYLL